VEQLEAYKALRSMHEPRSSGPVDSIDDILQTAVRFGLCTQLGRWVPWSRPALCSQAKTLYGIPVCKLRMVLICHPPRVSRTSKFFPLKEGSSYVRTPTKRCRMSSWSSHSRRRDCIAVRERLHVGIRRNIEIVRPRVAGLPRKPVKQPLPKDEAKTVVLGPGKIPQVADGAK